MNTLGELWRLFEDFIGGILWLAILLAALWGWVLNLIIVISSSHEVLTTLLALRIVGICIPPVGAILGYIHG